MTTDNRTNEPSEEQLQKAAAELRIRYGAGNGSHSWIEFQGNPRLIVDQVLAATGVAPQEPCPQPCEHLSAEDAREGRDCREHPCTCPTAPSSDREKLIEEARAVAGPKSLYAHTSVAHLLTRLADALAAQPVLDPDSDERVIAWERIAGHPALKPCYAEERPLLPAALDRLTNLFELEQTVTELAPAPVVVLDPEKVAEVLNQHEPIFKDGQYAGRCICGFEHHNYSGWRLHRSGALCEAYTEGKLT